MPNPNDPGSIVWDRDFTGKHLSDFMAPILQRGIDQGVADATVSTTYPASNIVTPSTTVPASTTPHCIRYFCPQCQNWTDGFPCVIHFQPLPAAGLGWECPRCRMIHAPWVAGCWCPAPTITTTGS